MFKSDHQNNYRCDSTSCWRFVRLHQSLSLTLGYFLKTESKAVALYLHYTSYRLTVPIKVCGKNNLYLIYLLF